MKLSLVDVLKVLKLSALSVCLVSVAGCSGGGILNSSEAACAQTLPNLEPEQAAPGESFRLYGDNFFAGCNDVVVNGEEPPSEPPSQNVRITFKQQGQSWRLATVDAEPDYSLEANPTVPEDAVPGEALVVVKEPSELPVEVPFQVQPEG